ncbi:MAG: isochorismate synthase [Rothia sp. (in: high G+C Gram-positive bacteria)]|nr:isochorismate synthase [Rothia sp. (in: high G+C Gram-positive bacteria)]
MSHLSALPSPFMLAEGTTVVRAEGALTPVDEADALSLAQRRNSAVVGLIPFDPHAPAQLAVPERWVAEETPLPVLKSVEQPAPSHLVGLDNEGYRASVAQAVELLNRGQLDKVVLARLLQISYDQELNLPHLFDTLRVQQERATVFSAQLPNGNYLMGASPELVLHTKGTSLRTVPLAGSAARTATPGSTDDAHVGEALLRSAKDRAEHATVVSDIRQRLGALTVQLHVPPVPSLLATPQLWHLSTPVTGQLLPGVSSLQAARAIHPTPAICGTPTDLARNLIEECEPFDRGFFGGLVGYMDACGQGSWYLVLRCAQVAPHTATLFAGAGIVKDSTPAGEHAETATKLGTFARALGLDVGSL